MGKKNATQTRPKPAGLTAPGQEAEKTQEQAPEQAPNPEPEQAPEETSEQAPEQAPESTPEQAPEQAPEETSEQGAEQAPEDKKKPKLPDFLTPYVKAYPKNHTFHATTDRMVFLEADLDMARAHQIGLGGGEVKTYKVK